MRQMSAKNCMRDSQLFLLTTTNIPYSTSLQYDVVKNGATQRTKIITLTTQCIPIPLPRYTTLYYAESHKYKEQRKNVASGCISSIAPSMNESVYTWCIVRL